MKPAVVLFVSILNSSLGSSDHEVDMMVVVNGWGEWRMLQGLLGLQQGCLDGS